MFRVESELKFHEALSIFKEGPKMLDRPKDFFLETSSDRFLATAMHEVMQESSPPPKMTPKTQNTPCAHGSELSSMRQAETKILEDPTAAQGPPVSAPHVIDAPPSPPPSKRRHVASPRTPFSGAPLAFTPPCEAPLNPLGTQSLAPDPASQFLVSAVCGCKLIPVAEPRCVCRNSATIATAAAAAAPGGVSQARRHRWHSSNFCRLHPSELFANTGIICCLRVIARRTCGTRLAA